MEVTQASRERLLPAAPGIWVKSEGKVGLVGRWGEEGQVAGKA